LQAIEEQTLYARVDGLEHDGEFMRMELELIEPVLFLGLGEEQLVPWQRPLHVRSRSRRLVKRQQSNEALVARATEIADRPSLRAGGLLRSVLWKRKEAALTAHNPLISLGPRGGLEPPTFGL
jgi:hypothetical protein